MNSPPELEALFQGDLDLWIDELPKYQQSTVLRLIGQGLSPEEAALAWLSPRGAQDTSPFGAVFDRKAFFEKLTEEFDKFICSESSYREERRKLLTEFNAKQTYAVAFVSATIAPVVGAAAPVLAPAIALIMFSVAKVGLVAWCKMRAESRNNEES